MIHWLEKRLNEWGRYVQGREWYGARCSPIGKLMMGEGGDAPGPRVLRTTGVIDHEKAVETCLAVASLGDLDQRLIWYRYAYYRALSVSEISKRCGISRAKYYRTMPNTLSRLAIALKSAIYCG